MNKTELKQRITEGLNNVVSNINGSIENPKACKNVFAYAAWCEHNFELNLRSDYKRKTTFTSDLSIREWCEGVHGITDTYRRALTEWIDNVEYVCELIIAVNMKSWEHAARKNFNLSRLYADLYHLTRDIVFDWYGESNKQHDKFWEYYYRYVD